MIEIIPDKPEITDELAITAARILQEYCKNHKCEACVLDETICTDDYTATNNWDLPED